MFALFIVALVWAGSALAESFVNPPEGNAPALTLAHFS